MISNTKILKPPISWVTRGLWAACLTLLGYQIWLSLPTLFDPHMVNDDFRQILFWTPALADSGLFRNDYLAEYSRNFITPGVVGLYWLAVRGGLAPIFFSKLLGWVIYAAMLAGVVRIGRVLARKTAPLACPLLILMVMLHNQYFCFYCMGGLPRNFALPLQIWILDGLLRRRLFRQALPLSLLAIIFHPQSFLIGAGAIVPIVALEWIRSRRFQPRRRARVLRRGMATLALCGLGLIPLIVQSQRTKALYGRVYTGAEIKAMREYRDDGRWPQERPLTLFQDLGVEINRAYLGKMTGPAAFLYQFLRDAWTAWFIYGSALLGLVWFALRRRRMWLFFRPVLLMILASLLLWGLAHLLLLKLYFPNRFLRPAVLLGALIVLASLSAELTGKLRPAAWRRAGWGWTGLLLLTFLSLFVRASMMECLNLTVYGRLVDYIRTLPKDAVCAAQPRSDADDLMTLGQRRFYVTYETTHPLYKKYYEEIRERTYLTLAALYPVNGDADVRALAARGVGYLIVNKRVLSRLARGNPAAPLYFEPYGKWLEQRLNDGGVRRRVMEYWLKNRGPAKIYEDKNFILFSLNYPGA